MVDRLHVLLTGTLGESLKDVFAGIEFQVFVIGVKSIVPYEEKVGCMLSLQRYEQETTFLKYYMNGRDEVTEYRIKFGKPSTSEDSLLDYRLMAAATVNTQWDVLMDEVIRSTAFFTFNRKSILHAMLLGSAIHDYLDGCDIDEMRINMRGRLIEFSVKDFFHKQYGMDINKSYLIGFERERVMLLTSEHIDDSLMKYKAYQSIMKDEVDNIEINKDNETILMNYETYLTKLRKGLIGPEKLKADTSEMHELGWYVRNTAFVHPILGKCTVQGRDGQKMIVKSKSGMMRMSL